MTWFPGHNRYDAIVSVTTLHHLELEPAIARLASWLEPGGRMIIVDLWRIAGPIDVAITLLAAPISRIRRLSQAARARSGRALWRAWDRHGATDRYLSMAEVRATFPRLLPGCRVRRHLAWRYSVVWDKV
jgi:SAM-dependent methyltransferase